jgi:hypothetical protein
MNSNTVIQPSHVHQDLINSYQEGQAWQYTLPHMDGIYRDCKEYGAWTKPKWNEETTYRLHPHDKCIQAYRNSVTIQIYRFGRWIDLTFEPCWCEDSQFRIKPVD